MGQNALKLSVQSVLVCFRKIENRADPVPLTSACTSKTGRDFGPTSRVKDKFGCCLFRKAMTCSCEVREVHVSNKQKNIVYISKIR